MATSAIVLTAILLVLFFGLMIAVGIHCRRHATDVSGFVLGGRSVGPWLTAFGTSYFSAVIFVGYAGQFGWNFGLASPGSDLATPSSARYSPGRCLEDGPVL